MESEAESVRRAKIKAKEEDGRIAKHLMDVSMTGMIGMMRY